MNPRPTPMEVVATGGVQRTERGKHHANTDRSTAPSGHPDGTKALRAKDSVLKNQGHPKVLVVDDEPGLRRLIVQFLNLDGIAAIDAGTADQGLAIVRQHADAIDLAIIDMVLPGMSGLDLAADIGREYPGLKILYMSGHGDSIAMQGIYQQSPESVLLKPFTELELLDQVNMLLEMSPKVGPAGAGLPLSR